MKTTRMERKNIEPGGRDDMGGQIGQVGENLKAALVAAEASAQNVMKTTTCVSDIDEFFKHARRGCKRAASRISTSW